MARSPPSCAWSRPSDGISSMQGPHQVAQRLTRTGRPVLVNLWATWCGPCIEEMPSLGRLQAQLGGDLAILAISEDRSGAAAVEPFLARVAVGDLAVYLDATDAAIKAFGVQGLPTTLLIGRDGKVAFKLEGAADWDSPAMVARLRAFIEAKTP